jgi:hypothetical protein
MEGRRNEVFFFDTPELELDASGVVVRPDVRKASTTTAACFLPRINYASRRSLQVTLLVPILAGLVGLLVSFLMMRLPDIQSSGAPEGIALG